MDAPLNKPIRCVGKLEKFEGTPLRAHAYVRVEEKLLHVPMNSRGTLQGDGSIKLCVNGDRYDKIETGADIVLDLIKGANGTFSPGLWAPKQRLRR